jgi:hypothetical protein
VLRLLRPWGIERETRPPRFIERHTCHVTEFKGLKRLSDDAYDAFVEALAVFYWWLTDFETFVRDALGDAPEILARLDFKLSKRVVAVEVLH